METGAKGPRRSPTTPTMLPERHKLAPTHERLHLYQLSFDRVGIGPGRPRALLLAYINSVNEIRDRQDDQKESGPGSF